MPATDGIELCRALARAIRFELHNQTVELHGFAATASDLIGALKQLPAFEAPLFRSPVTQEGWSGTKRLQVWVELASERGR